MPDEKIFQSESETGIKLYCMNASSRRSIAASVVAFVAPIIFGIGLIEPLTPSDGHPSFIVWLVFLFLPLVLMAVAFVVAKTWPVKIVLLVEGILILLVTVDLVRINWGL
jgi:hypothetical protein